jgi:hypothetical protein
MREKRRKNKQSNLAEGTVESELVFFYLFVGWNVNDLTVWIMAATTKDVIRFV